jgi:excisionase family DNA binding protein
MSTPTVAASQADHYSTIEVARLLGLAVRSVQLMVDRGELDAWKTPGGHRRISKTSVERWLRSRGGPSGAAAVPAAAPAVAAPKGPAGRVLYIEDSAHYQKLVSLLMRQQFPNVELYVADDGIAGLAMAGQLQPDVLLVDLLLPGIDGATLIASLRSHQQFSRIRLIVLTSLDEPARAPYAFALEGVPVVHKADLVARLPGLLEQALAAHRQNASAH